MVIEEKLTLNGCKALKKRNLDVSCQSQPLSGALESAEETFRVCSSRVCVALWHFGISYLYLTPFHQNPLKISDGNNPCEIKKNHENLLVLTAEPGLRKFSK